MLIDILPSSLNSHNDIFIVDCGVLKRVYHTRITRKKGRGDFHILYIESGVCFLELDGKMIKVGPGEIIMFRPNEPQYYYFDKNDKTVTHYIHFKGQGCDELLKRLGIYGTRVLKMGKSSKYEDYSAKMCREFKSNQPFSSDLATALLFVLLSIIARKALLKNNSVSCKNEARISRACQTISENIAEKPSIAELAAQSGLSVSRFSHLFSEVVGKSVSEYIISTKMDAACRAFEYTDLPVSEVAKSVGYSDPKYFSTIFKKYVGYSPRKFIKIVTEKDYI